MITSLDDVLTQSVDVVVNVDVWLDSG